MHVLKVAKGSKALFDCVLVEEVLEEDLARYQHGHDVLKRLDVNEVCISKRLSMDILEGMVAQSSVKPVECLVEPVAAHETAFRNLGHDLLQRKRAGVALVSNGRMLLFIPLRDYKDRYMRCMLLQEGQKDYATANSSTHMSDATDRVNVIESISSSTPVAYDEGSSNDPYAELRNQVEDMHVYQYNMLWQWMSPNKFDDNH